jgi:glutaredoxin
VLKQFPWHAWADGAMPAGRLPAMVFFLVSLKDFVFILFIHPDGPNPAGVNASFIISAQPAWGCTPGKEIRMSESEKTPPSEDSSQPDVKIFSLSTCSHCKAAKKFIGECTIKYDFVDVDMLEGDERKAIIADVKKFNPRCSFPTIIIGEKVIVGYKETEIKEALGLK